MKDDVVPWASFWSHWTTSAAGQSAKNQGWCGTFSLFLVALHHFGSGTVSKTIFLSYFFPPFPFVAAVRLVLSVYWCFSLFLLFLGCCHVSCHFNPFARKVRLHKTPFAEPKNQTGPRLQFIPGIDNHDNHRVQWLRNWLRVSWSLRLPGACLLNACLWVGACSISWCRWLFWWVCAPFALREL